MKAAVWLLLRSSKTEQATIERQRLINIADLDSDVIDADGTRFLCCGHATLRHGRSRSGAGSVYAFARPGPALTPRSYINHDGRAPANASCSAVARSYRNGLCGIFTAGSICSCGYDRSENATGSERYEARDPAIRVWRRRLHRAEPGIAESTTQACSQGTGAPARNCRPSTPGPGREPGQPGHDGRRGRRGRPGRRGRSRGRLGPHYYYPTATTDAGAAGSVG